ncbi:hypothetical protein LTR95_011234 [Oleoguttula sp. CCFEE 5521]
MARGPSRRLADKQAGVVRSTNLFGLGDPAQLRDAAAILANLARTHVHGAVPAPAIPVAPPLPQPPQPPQPPQNPPPPQPPLDPPPNGPQPPGGPDPVPKPIPPGGDHGASQPDDGAPVDTDGNGSNDSDPEPGPPDGGADNDEQLPVGWPDMIFTVAELGGAQNRLQAREILRKASFRDSSWQCGHKLGEGSFGFVFAAYQLDAQQDVINLAAVKDCYVDQTSWDNWIHWDGDARDAQNRVPIEVGTLTAIKNKSTSGSEKIVRLRHACPVNLTKRSYRIYMDYYNGTLDLATRSRQGQNFPEPIIWRWLEDLTEGCLVMSEGNIDDDTPRPADWKRIVNRDIKPSNILLGDPVGQGWRTIASCRMADWGGAVYTHAADPHNPLSYNYHAGTFGFRPLKLVGGIDRLTGCPTDNGLIGDHTNVWQIGATLIAVASMSVEPNGDIFDPVFTGRAAAPGQTLYSRQLKSLLYRCTMMEPEGRIDLHTLQQAIWQHTDGAEGGELPDLADGARNEDDNFGMRYEPVWPRRWVYRLNFSVPVMLTSDLPPLSTEEKEEIDEEGTTPTGGNEQHPIGISPGPGSRNSSAVEGEARESYHEDEMESD